MSDINTQDACPRCHHSPLRSWRELTDQQRELVRRLPAAADYSEQERITRHRFCPRCWYEETSQSQLI